MNLEETIQKILAHTKLNREEIKQKIDEQIQDLSGLIDEEGAIVIVAKNLGIDLKENQDAAKIEQDQTINQVQPRINVNIVGKIIEVDEIRTFNKKDGTQGSLLAFIIEDKTGMIRCLAWGEQHTQIVNVTGFEVGEVVRVVNGYTKEGREGTLEVHLGNKSRIQIQPDDVDMKNIKMKGENHSSITPIKDLSIKKPTINVQGIVITNFEPKTFPRKDGGEGKRAALQIQDETGIAFITFWGKHCEKIESVQTGALIKITKLTPKPNFRDKTKIDLTATSLSEIIIVEETKNSQTAALIKKNEEKISSIQTFQQSEGIGTIEGKIIEVEDIRTITLKDGTQKELQKILVADETGSIKITLWGKQTDVSLKIDQTLRFNGILAKLNNFSKQIEGNLIRTSFVESIEKTIKAVSPVISGSTPVYEKNQRTTIEDINQDKFYNFKGTIVKEITRLTIYKACSKCNKKIENCQCSPKGEEQNRIILNILLDDESNTIRATLMAERAENFLDEKTDTIVNLKEKNELDQFLEQKSQELVGKEFVFHGRAKYSQYSESYEINVNSFEPINLDSEITQLLNVLESK